MSTFKDIRRVPNKEVHGTLFLTVFLASSLFSLDGKEFCQLKDKYSSWHDKSTIFLNVDLGKGCCMLIGCPFVSIQSTPLSLVHTLWNMAKMLCRCTIIVNDYYYNHCFLKVIAVAFACFVSKLQHARTRKNLRKNGDGPAHHLLMVWAEGGGLKRARVCACAETTS